MTGVQEDPAASSEGGDESVLHPKDDLAVGAEEEEEPENVEDAEEEYEDESVLHPKDDLAVGADKEEEPENVEDAEEEYEDEEDEEESDEEEEEDEEDEGDSDIDMDDDFALLAMAKKRLAEQREKQEKMDQQARVAAEEDDDDDDDEDHSEEDEDDDDDQVKPDTNDNDDLEEATNDSDDLEEDDDLEEAIDDEEEEEGHQEDNTHNDDQKDVDGQHNLSVSFQEPPAAASPTRRERDENAELWALLRQSKTRVAETKDMAVLADDDSDSDDDESEAAPEASSAVEKESEAVASAATDDVVNSTAGTIEDEEKDEESKRNFEKENQELWELLAKSKSRLEEAALQKMREAEKAAAEDEDLPPRQTSVVDENPYKDIDVLPDETTGDESEEALTQKELLLAMAVAEEAARSGKEVFETPSKEELRTRDIESFDFVKKNQPANLPAIPETPIGNDAVEEERERNRFAMLSQSLSTRWTAFRQRMNEIDQSTR